MYFLEAALAAGSENAKVWAETCLEGIVYDRWNVLFLPTSEIIKEGPRVENATIQSKPNPQKCPCPPCDGCPISKTVAQTPTAASMISSIVPLTTESRPVNQNPARPEITCKTRTAYERNLINEQGIPGIPGPRVEIGDVMILGVQDHSDRTIVVQARAADDLLPTSMRAYLFSVMFTQE